MTLDSRTKGRTAEREVERILQDAGLTCDRALSGRHQAHGDIVTEGLAIEVRRRDRLSLSAWSREHEALTPQHLTPVVVYRASREPWRASLPLADFVDLMKEARA